MIRQIFKSGFSKNVLLLSLGTGISQLVSLGASPILTRLYSPFEFGIYTFFISFVSTISVVGAGRLELAQLIPKSTKGAVEIKATARWFTFLFSLIVGLIIVFWNPFENYNNEMLKWLAPFAIMLLAFNSIENYFAVRLKAFKILTTLNLVKSFFNNGMAIVLGIFHYSLGLILGFLCGNVAFNLFSSILIPRTNFFKINRRRVLSTLEKYKQYPLTNSLSSVTNVASNQLPIILMAFLFDSTIIGFYGLLMKVLNIPLTFLGRSISQVFFSKFSQESLDQETRKNFYAIALLLFAVISIILIPFYFIGQDLFSIAFGADWKEAGRLIQFFIPFYILRFVYYCMSTIFLIHKELKIELFQNIGALAMQLLALLIGGYILRNSDLTFLLIGSFGCLSYLIFILQMFRIINKHSQ